MPKGRLFGEGGFHAAPLGLLDRHTATLQALGQRSQRSGVLGFAGFSTAPLGIWDRGACRVLRSTTGCTPWAALSVPPRLISGCGQTGSEHGRGSGSGCSLLTKPPVCDTIFGVWSSPSAFYSSARLAGRLWGRGEWEPVSIVWGMEETRSVAGGAQHSSLCAGSFSTADAPLGTAEPGGFLNRWYFCGWPLGWSLAWGMGCTSPAWDNTGGEICRFWDLAYFWAWWNGPEGSEGLSSNTS